MYRPLAILEEATGAARKLPLYFRDNGDGDLVGGLRTNVKSDRRVYPVDVIACQLNSFGFKFFAHFIEPFPRAEHANVGGGSFQECPQDISVVFIIVRHQYTGGIGGNVKITLDKRTVAKR